MKKKTMKELGDFLEMDIAMDEDGKVFAYGRRPILSDGEWGNRYCETYTDIINVTKIIVFPSCDWKHSLYVPACMKTKYKAYTEPKLEWVGKILVNPNNFKYEIVGKKDNDLVVFGYDTTKYSAFNLEPLYSLGWTWAADGTPFGELICEKK